MFKRQLIKGNTQFHTMRTHKPLTPSVPAQLTFILKNKNITNTEEPRARNKAKSKFSSVLGPRIYEIELKNKTINMVERWTGRQHFLFSFYHTYNNENKSHTSF
jgi:hypothetical protein